MAKYKIKIDTPGCIGCGTCVALCPDNFELDGDKAKVLKDKVDSLDCINDAKDSCPTSVISIEEI